MPPKSTIISVSSEKGEREILVASLLVFFSGEVNVGSSLISPENPFRLMDQEVSFVDEKRM